MQQKSKPYQALVELCQHPEIKNNAREVNEMLGVICVMAASPEPLELQQWFPCLWANEKEPSFSDEGLAVGFAAAVLQYYEHCLLHYQQAKPLLLPKQCWLNKDQQVTEQGRAFACGYLSGFHYNEVNWQALNWSPGSEPEQLLQTSMLLLSKMATPESNDPQMQALFAQLPDMPEIVASVAQLLAVLGNVSTRVNNDD